MKERDHPIDQMLQCHKEILEQTERVERALDRFSGGGSAEDMILTLDVFLLFMKTTLKLHKMDEENALFPCIRRSGYAGEAVETLLRDHEELDSLEDFLALITEMKSVEPSKLEEKLRHAVEDLKKHIEHEETVIYAFARDNLSAEDLREVGRQMKALRE